MHKVEKQIEINAPVEEVFALFSRFDHCSRWMKGIKNVEWVAPKRTRWTAETLDGKPLVWEAEVTELAPGRHLTWHSTGGDIEAEGAARFETTPQGTTLMHLSLGYSQPQWQADELTGATFGDDLEQRLEDDLIWFRLYAERESQADDEVESAAAAPALSATATAAPSAAADEAQVHFDTFSTIRRAGKVIRPARPLTAPLPGQPEAARAVDLSERPDNSYGESVATPPNSYFSGDRPSRQPVVAYVVIGLLLVVVVGLFAAIQRRDEVDVGQVVAPAESPVVSPTLNQQSVKPTVTPTETAAAAATPVPLPTSPTAVMEAAPLPAVPPEDRAPEAKSERNEEPSSNTDADARETVQATLNSWLAATNQKNINAQMGFYAPVLQRYYLRSGFSRAGVRAEKILRFAHADSVRISTGEPEITFEQEGHAARVRFRKQYEITGSEGTQSGEVLQELIMIKSGDNWRIISERDLRVLR